MPLLRYYSLILIICMLQFANNTNIGNFFLKYKQKHDTCQQTSGLFLDKNRFLSDLDEKLEIYQNENLAMANQVSVIGKLVTAHGIFCDETGFNSK